jgi:DNA polymerase III subunit gamma/tau
MALDTKYRPQTYDDVLGQEATVTVLQQYVKEGRGFHQSYVFCGQHGSGKTTLGRILARALLCENPVGGSPCDQCSSCRTFLEGGTHECFEELDAATRSGKGDLSRIIEDVQYSTVSGKRRIYLFDESHRLSKQALDALLKPMEDNVLGSEDKRLVCIFCTTEPEKMVGTIFSRCAPSFVIRSASLGVIANRLSYICGEEGIDSEPEALTLIAEQSSSHIRDALKMLEGASLSGPLTREAVASYLHLESNGTVLELLGHIGSDLAKAVETAAKLSLEVSPSAAYERVAEAALLAYQVHLGVASVPSKWETSRLKVIAEQGGAMLNTAMRFAAPPHRPTAHTLILDTATAHHLFGVPSTAPLPGVTPPPLAPVLTSPPTRDHSFSAGSSVSAMSQPPESDSVGKVGHASQTSTAKTTANGVWVDPRAVARGPKPKEAPSSRQTLSPLAFRELVRHHLCGLVKDGLA